MEALVVAIADFVRVRQLNIAVAALLTLAYLMYQYREMLFKGQDDADEVLEVPRRRSTARLSRSRSRSCSRDRSKNYDYKIRRGKRPRRCHNCNSYSYDD